MQRYSEYRKDTIIERRYDDVMEGKSSRNFLKDLPVFHFLEADGFGDLNN